MRGVRGGVRGWGPCRLHGPTYQTTASTPCIHPQSTSSQTTPLPTHPSHFHLTQKTSPFTPPHPPKDPPHKGAPGGGVQRGGTGGGRGCLRLRDERREKGRQAGPGEAALAAGVRWGTTPGLGGGTFAWRARGRGGSNITGLILVKAPHLGQSATSWSKRRVLCKAPHLGQSAEELQPPPNTGVEAVPDRPVRGGAQRGAAQRVPPPLQEALGRG